MNITLKVFAGLRDIIGQSSLQVQVPPGTTVGQLWEQFQQQYPRLQNYSPVALTVNLEYAPPDTELQEGDEVAFIPPVSGGQENEPVRGRSEALPLIAITSEPLDVTALEEAVAHPTCGAVVTFVGRVREHHQGRRVRYLEYEAYPEMARRKMGQIGEEIRARWGVERVAMVHRVGRLTIGEASIVIAVAAPHRAEAFAACRYAIDRLKEDVPIWKKEYWEDGAEWIEEGQPGGKK
ncbi:MAG TPA: MoaD family protein [Armatimonadetes bacterium]|nr:MoaD family protein [Armatimonadota bacterium]